MPDFSALVRTYPVLHGSLAALAHAFDLLRHCFSSGGKLLVCGNGGSASDAEHITGELMKGYLLKRPIPAETRLKLIQSHPDDGPYLAERLQGALPVLSLVSQGSLLSAIANDTAPDMVYAQQVYGYGKPGDCLLGISTSGNSKNIIRAVQVANSLGLHTLGLTGPEGGALKKLCQVTICVPGSSTPAVQELHLPIFHALCAELEAAFFSE